MARPFKVNEAEDLDLNLLVNKFLDQKPDYLPVSGNGGYLILLPYADGAEFSEEFYLCPETLTAADSFDWLPAKDEPLM